MLPPRVLNPPDLPPCDVAEILIQSGCWTTYHDVLCIHASVSLRIPRSVARDQGHLYELVPVHASVCAAWNIEKHREQKDGPGLCGSPASMKLTLTTTSIICEVLNT